MGYDVKSLKNYKIENSGLNLDKYEMFYVTLSFNDGKNMRIRTFVDKRTFDLSPDVQKLKENRAEYRRFMRVFFVDRLLGPDGYLQQDGRNDMIYLGKIALSDSEVAYVNREHKRPNGKVALEEFEESLFKLKVQLMTKEGITKTSKLKKRGKSYVISDIHGMYGSYMEAVSKLKDSDTLYVLGDVVDRKEFGIEIIQDMMKRDNVNFIIGNHEWLTLQAIDILKKYNLTNYEFDEIFAEDSEVTRGMDQNDTAFLGMWLFVNGGLETIRKFLELSSEEQEAIYTFLSNSALIQKIDTESYKICLAHASPPNDSSFINLIESRKDGIITFGEVNKNLGKGILEQVLEERTNTDGFELWASKGYVTIYGHEPQKKRMINRDDKRRRIGIDTGCCCKNGKLAMFCLDDGKVEYIEPKLEYTMKKPADPGAPGGENR